MFFNSQNSAFPFCMPNMNQQMPFMPFPFPSPFKKAENQSAADQAPVEGEETAQKGFNPCDWCPVSKMPQMEQFQEMFKKLFPMAGGNCQGFNPFAWCQMPQMPQMEQFQEMFKKMFSMAGGNCQGFNPFAWCQIPQMPQMPQMDQFQEMFKKMFPMGGGNSQGFNPFAWCQMPQMPQMPQLEQFQEMFKKLFSKLNMKDENNANGLPFGMPVKFLQILLNMDSNPDGLSKFQKILDLIFDEYSKTKAPAEESAAEEPAE